MSLKIFRSDDAGAPLLTQAQGTWIALLKKILGTEGYNATTPSAISRVGTTVTVTDAGANRLTDEYITIAGVNEAGFNGTFKITALTIDSYTYTSTVSGTTTATGTFSAKKAGIGWTEAYSTTNNQSWITPNLNKYIEITEPSATTYSIFGYSAMTAAATGSSQIASSTNSVTKSAAGAANYCWMIIVVNDKFVYAFNSSTTTATSIGTLAMWVSCFGETENGNLLVSSFSSTAANCFVVNYSSATGNNQLKALFNISHVISPPPVSLNVPFSLWGVTALSALSIGTDTSIALPDYGTGGEVLFKASILQTDIKAELDSFPALYIAGQNLLGVYGNFGTATYTTGTFADKSFLVLKCGNVSTATGFIMLEK